MTIKQLIRANKSYLAEFDRAVVRRRAYIKKFMKTRLNARKAAKNPNNSTTRQAVSLKKKLHDAIYRSIMNKAGSSKCGRWRRTRNGDWTIRKRCDA
jgi:hypothetical protein